MPPSGEKKRRTSWQILGARKGEEMLRHKLELDAKEVMLKWIKRGAPQRRICSCVGQENVALERNGAWSRGTEAARAGKLSRWCWRCEYIEKGSVRQQ